MKRLSMELSGMRPMKKIINSLAGIKHVMHSMPHLLKEVLSEIGTINGSQRATFDQWECHRKIQLRLFLILFPDKPDTHTDQNPGIGKP